VKVFAKDVVMVRVVRRAGRGVGLRNAMSASLSRSLGYVGAISNVEQRHEMIS
jgi:hypothetical protein